MQTEKYFSSFVSQILICFISSEALSACSTLKNTYIPTNKKMNISEEKTCLYIVQPKFGYSVNRHHHQHCCTVTNGLLAWKFIPRLCLSCVISLNLVIFALLIHSLSYKLVTLNQRSDQPVPQYITFYIVSRCFENNNNNCCETNIC